MWGLAAICQLHRRPFAPNLVLQQFPPPYNASSLQAAASALNLRRGLHTMSARELAALSPPFLAVLAPAGETASGLAVVLKCDRDSVLLLTEQDTTPATLRLTEFDARYGGVVLVCTPAIESPAPEDPAGAATAAFGFRWFVPELLKHKA